MPPSPPTTVAVIESIATGAPQRVSSIKLQAADHVAWQLFDLDPEQRDPDGAGVSRRRGVDTRRMAVDPLDADFDAFRTLAGHDPGPDEPVLRACGSAGGRRGRDGAGRRRPTAPRRSDCWCS